jgi:hypothetical protein
MPKMPIIVVKSVFVKPFMYKWLSVRFDASPRKLMMVKINDEG